MGVSALALFATTTVNWLITPDAVPPTVASSLTVCTAIAAIWVTWPRSRRWVAEVLGAVALVSGSASVVHLWSGGPSGAWIYTETLGLLILIATVARVALAYRALAAVLAAGLAESTLILRVVPSATLLDAVGMCAFWGIGATGAAGIGLHLRSLDSERIRSVAGARRAQRLELARDLHDFVAHDLSELVIRAQVGQLTPGSELDMLRRIERAGQRALTSVSATVRALHEMNDSDAVLTDSAWTFGDLPRIVEEFAASGPIEATLHVEPGLEAHLPRRVGTASARVVVEALTNVRRHAVGATTVDVTITS